MFAPFAIGAANPELSGVAHAEQAHRSASLRWNWEARDIVRRNRVDPLWASRTYAIVSVAQYNAAATAGSANATNEAFTSTAIAASAATVLVHLYPHEVPRVSAVYESQQELMHSLTSSEQDRARVLGEAEALRLLEERRNDGAISLAAVAPPSRTGVWRSAERWAPLRTYWGQVRPFLVHRIEDLAAPPPPELDSPEFQHAIAVVRTAREAASAKNDRIAKLWADGPGTTTPPGHWNQIAAELIARHGLGELESSHVLALMNMALMDAGIACWRDKFKFWLLRPPQVDPRIVPSFALPNFPSYPSGHAAFSGAASAFLSERFPDEREELNRIAEEAALSRVVSGIHYPFDSEAGLQQGRRIASLAIARYRHESQGRVAAQPRSPHKWERP